jgi:hypothetical protein
MILEAISKTRLKLDGCVASQLKMLTYYRVCSAFSLPRALPSNLIQIFEIASSKIFLKYDPDREEFLKEKLSELRSQIS